MMQFIDLKAQYRRIQGEVDRRMQQVFAHGQFVMGPEIKELEIRLAEYVGVRHCVALSSGTDALLVALMALGISAGDEVITSPFSFMATASMIKMLGAVPVFVDIDPRTYNLNPALIEQAITHKTRAILPVNLYGQCADYDAINAIAQRHGLPVIEDAAQSFGATYKNRRSGGLGTHIGCTSFFPSKPLGCYGDGGACFTDDDELAMKMMHIRNHGQDRRYHHICLGINGRLDTLQAAVLLAKLDIFADELQRRATVAEYYHSGLNECVTTPYIEPHNTSVYAQYTIRVDARDAVTAALTAQGIPTAVHYPLPINRQPLISHLNGSGPTLFPYSDEASAQVLSLPFHPYLLEADIQKIVHLLQQALKNPAVSVITASPSSSASL
jgi:UDP-2-acetamido-2-deoxy-ribo-hexuluronate aminotransferase